MIKLWQKAKGNIIILGIGLMVVILAITILFSINKNENKFISENDYSLSISTTDQITQLTPEVVKPSINIEVPPIQEGTINRTVNQKVENVIPSSNENQTQKVEPISKSIQEGQPKVYVKPTEPPKPIPDGEMTNKAAKPAYKKDEIKPKQAKPKMGDKKANGEIYVEGFGWIKDCGGGQGTVVGRPGDELTGEKIGIMN